MARAVYYLPGKGEPTRARLRAVEFPHVDQASLPGVRCNKGPDGGVGQVFPLSFANGHAKAHDATPGYYPNKQTWQKCGGWYLGWMTDEPPRPVDLQYKAEIAGQAVRLRDGHEWLIPPAVQPFDGTCLLPRGFGLNADGQPDRVVLPEHAELWELGQRIWGTMWAPADRPEDQSAKPEPLNDADCLRAVALALRRNYVMSSWELQALELLADEELIEAVRAIVGYPLYLEALKTMEAEQQKKSADPGP